MSIRIREISDELAEAKVCPVEDSLSENFGEIKAFSLRKERHFQLARNTLIENTAIDFSVFRIRGRLFELVIKANPQFPVTLDKAKLDEIRADNYDILIESASIPRYRAYLESAICQSRPAEDILTARRANLLKETSKILMKELLDNPDSREKIEEIKTSVVGIIDILFENVDMIRNMLSLSQYDYYTYTHCVDVAVLSAGLGVSIGLTNADVLNLGIGAMLHDIGKSAIAPELLNKQGKLDDREYRTIQQHVEAGVSILQRHKGIPEGSYYAVAQHHEKLSGKGYPLGLRGGEVTLFGRMVLIT
ncbi:MAG: HD-GYP domain-containing protein [Dissulfurispiraceae bacterium]